LIDTDIRPGMRIKVSQTIVRRDESWQSETVGTILQAEPRPTGSWYAHGKDDKYWLVRIVLQKDDGEITTLTLDHNTQIAVLDA
jgi:hypothetical protein